MMSHSADYPRGSEWRKWDLHVHAPGGGLIIMVSHDANLVVGADAEQVIVTNRHGADRKNEDGRLFDYFSGSLEHTATRKETEIVLQSGGIREHACDISTAARTPSASARRSTRSSVVRLIGQDDPVPEHPAAIKRLNSLFSASLIAHEAIFEMRRELIVGETDNADQTHLLAESARITMNALPNLAAAARDLAASWEEQNLLDPDAAEITLRELATELGRIGPETQALLNRQREIAAQLRTMLDT